MARAATTRRDRNSAPPRTPPMQASACGLCRSSPLRARLPRLLDFLQGAFHRSAYVVALRLGQGCLECARRLRPSERGERLGRSDSVLGVEIARVALDIVGPALGQNALGIALRLFGHLVVRRAQRAAQALAAGRRSAA